MKNNKILYIVNIDWFFVSHRLPIAIKAKELGYEVHIATKITSELDKLNAHGFHVHSLKIHRSKFGFKVIFNEFLEIYSIMRQINPTLVHLITIKAVLFGGIAARILKISSVVSAISGLGFTFIRVGFLAKLFRLLISIIYRFSLNHKNQIVIFQNSDDQIKLNRIAKISYKKSLIINGSGVDLVKFNIQPLPTGVPIILFSSRLLVDKGIREFINAAKIIKKNEIQARFVVAGQIDLSNPASLSEKEINNYKKTTNIEFLGHVNEEMSEIYSNATIVVLPSYREGFPKVLIEAAACGRAVVTTNVPGCIDAIENNKTGLLVNPRNTEMLANAIEKLINDKDLCKSMGKAGRARAENLFDINAVVLKHMEIYKQLIIQNTSNE